MTEQRRRLLFELAAAVCRVRTAGTVRVGIDGVDGAGKTSLADELSVLCEAAGRTVIRASVDGFHNPRAIRYQRGRTSPEGFYYDSCDYATLKGVLLDPLGPGGSGRYRIATFDHRLDCAIVTPECIAASGDILLFDGIFFFLDVEFAVSIPRGAQRGEGSADPDAASNDRYVRGARAVPGQCIPDTICDRGRQQQRS